MADCIMAPLASQPAFWPWETNVRKTNLEEKFTLAPSFSLWSVGPMAEAG